MSRLHSLDSPRAVPIGSSASDTRRQRPGHDKAIRQWPTSRHKSNLTAFMVVVTSAACCLLQVDGFSSIIMNNQHRIRTISNSLSLQRIPSKNSMMSFSDKLRLFGGARRNPSRLCMAKSGKSSDQADWKALLIFGLGLSRILRILRRR